jgi:hypothetical protein
MPGTVRRIAWTVTCLVVLGGLPRSAHPAPPGNDGVPHVLMLAKEAAIAARVNLRSGSAKGTFRMWGPDRQLTLVSSFEGAFEGPKDYLRLVHEPPDQNVPCEYDKQILVCDGSDVFASMFSKRLKPLGVSASVSNKAEHGFFSPRLLGGFPCGIKMLAGGVFPLEAVEKYAVTTEELPNGNWQCVCRSEQDSRTMFEIAPEQGHHCVLVESFQGDALTNRWTVDWQCDGDLWHATGGKNEWHMDGRHYESYEWQFDEFEANIPVPAERFTLDALELCGNARIIDLRLPEGVSLTESGQPTKFEPKIYRVPDNESKTEEEQADRLIDQVKAMPRAYETEEVSGRWGLLGVIIGIVSPLAIALVWFLARRASQDSNDEHEARE